MKMNNVRLGIDLLMGLLIIACISLAAGLAYIVWSFIV